MPSQKVLIGKLQEVQACIIQIPAFPMAEQPTVGETKVTKNALPVPGSKLGGNPALRMMGESISSLGVNIRKKEAGTGD